ncbi:MAG: ATP-binding protein [Thermoflexibacter sp.]|nr:ATP-binding protein [Thermoflexibacter sp.]
MKTSNIKSFSIKGLFGTTDVHIPFDEGVKILIGENGLGKTQVLSIFYYTLMKNFYKLSDFSFESVNIEFAKKQITFKKNEIQDSMFPFSTNPSFRRFLNSPDDLDIFASLRNEVMNKGLSRSEFRRFLIENKVDISTPSEIIYDLIRFEFRDDREEDIFSQNIKDCIKAIDNETSQKQILYFPTFRRVEEDLRNLGYEEEAFGLKKNDSRLINFGMGDVASKFKDISNIIKTLASEGFAKISSEILSQLVKGLPKIDKTTLESINPADIEIILARVGNKISNDDKKRILNIVQTKEFDYENDISLIYFLQKLIDIYDQQRDLDKMIKSFVFVCNKYLVQKEVVYDESEVKIYIKSQLSNNEIKLSKLSSGEKQIISIFSKIYLSNENERFIILFDEPELSLSIIWQEMLLPDILNSGKCEFLLAATHSPFIYDDNGLTGYAITLSEYMSIPHAQEPILIES